MKVYVILCEDLWLNTYKVSQEGYKTLEDARVFCRERVGLTSDGTNPAAHAFCTENHWVYANSVTKDKYTIVEVTV